MNQDNSFIDAELNNKTYRIYNPTIIQGWQCPRCQKINSPTLMQCFCNEYQPYQQPMKPYCDNRSGDIIC